MTASADRLGDRITRILDRASRDAGARMARNITRAVNRISPVRVLVEADLRAFGRSIDTLANFPAVSIPVTPDVDRAQFEAAVQAALAGLEVSVRVVPDLDGFDAAIRAHNTPTVNVDVDADRSSLSRLSGLLSGIGRAAGKALSIGAVGIAAAGAAQGVLALTAALAPAAGIIAALPAVIAGGVAAMAALKLATAGVGDALKAAASGDAEALADALEKLSPSAREAVSAFAALQPRLKELQQSVQEAFFTRFSGDVKGALTNLLPLQSALGGISAQFGRAASEALKFAASKDALDGLRGILAGTHAALSGLAPATAPVLKGFLDVASAVSTAFGQRVGTALRDTLTQFGNFLSVSAASGQAVAWVDGAVTVFKQLGDIVGNVGGIIKGVFSAANDVGGGFLANLQQITQGFEDFVKSTQGQEAISGIFTALSAVAAQLAPILGALVSTLGAVAPALAPLFTLIGPAITGVIEALGPLIAGLLPGIEAVVGGLVSGLAAITQGGNLAALGAAFGDVLSALAPLLPVVGELVAALSTALAPVLSTLATALAPVIRVFSDLVSSVLPPLTSAFLTLVDALAPVVVIIGQVLAEALSAAAPLFTTLAALVEQVAVALTPLIAQITAALIPAFDALVPAVAAIVAALVPFITALVEALLPVLPPVIEALLAVTTAVIPLIGPLGELTAVVLGFGTTLVTALAPVLQFLAGVVSWVAINGIVPVITNLVTVVNGIIGVLSAVISAVSGFVPKMISFFSNLGSTVSGLVSSMVNAVVSFFSGLPGRALSAVSSIVGFMTGVFNSAKAAVIGVVTGLVADAVTLVRELPGKAVAALGNLGSTLYSAGQDLIRGLINGVASMASAIADKAKSVVSGAISAAKSALGIASPSKVFREIGVFLGQGFVNGMAATQSSIKAASEKLVGLVRKAFEGRKTRLDDVLIRQIRGTEKTLLGLAAKREAIADRIKKANEFAASTAASALQLGGLDRIGTAGGVGGLTAGLDAAVNKIRKFTAQVAALAKRGLRRDLLSQVIGLGADQGAGLANTLSNATAEQIRDLNEAQSQLAEASKGLGQTSADALFDAGKRAGDGFLAGLKAQQFAITQTMTKIARDAAEAFRRALGIHSPSTVMRGFGRNTMDGLDLGMQDRIANVRRTAVGAARDVSGAFSGGLGLGSGGGARGAQTGSQGVTNNRTVAPVINVYEVGNAQATAERILQRLVTAGGF